MAKRKTTQELLEKVAKKQEQMKAYEKQLNQRLAAENRKARTKRLIAIGAEVESVYGNPIEADMLPKLRSFLMAQESRGRYFSKALAKTDDTSDSLIKSDEEV